VKLSINITLLYLTFLIKISIYVRSIYEIIIAQALCNHRPHSHYYKSWSN